MTGTTGKAIRIGGASGYWGDSQEAPRQLVMQGNIDYLVFDYLAEVTMSILARARQKSPELGYARDFVDLVMGPLLKDIKAKGIKVVANAGGVNTRACAEAVAKIAREQNIHIRIAFVEGDDLMDQEDQLQAMDIKEMFTGAPMPSSLISANAYLGAFPIAAALDAGADIVITGRCVDSAVTLGPLIHEFGWTLEDYDKLAAGTLAGHIVECGAQATGGNFTDWQDVVDGWDNMGYPIAECHADGTFSITKPDNTGGLVSRLTVGEQILYEIGDPAAYIVPDVICDFTGVTLTETGPNTVLVEGVRGLAPTGQYKVSATTRSGYRSTATTVITGFDAAAKGRAFAESLLKRTRRLFRERNLGDYRETAIHLVGAQTLWGDNRNAPESEAREVTMRLDVRHDNREALDLFSKEATGVALSMTTGRCSGGAAGRPKITPVVALFSFLLGKDFISPAVYLDGEKIPYQIQHPAFSEPGADTATTPDAMTMPPATGLDEDGTVSVPLIDLAVARSGDKGNHANVGVLSRSPDYTPYIAAALTPEAVGAWFSHNAKGDTSRFPLPGMGAFNFLIENSLGGGGTSSLHLDSQAKTYGQQILAMPVPVPASLAEQAQQQNARRSAST
ncbi:acyclic terpene utilization AtuA family protein [Sneathiella chinensis]|uniref:Terpene utilization protein AtuA n=1 Tax=Sneathiella chinensis TaxID=349750 RepID=A0ABQ5U085_9PROT|nr:acyclic terpene utilization AtuA family protein [Sneathiella chinensis]GLQ05550.1 hypothetical protein GCM10007924_07710 [Sneathiella chinensis]